MSEIRLTPPDLKVVATAVVVSNIPVKSKAKYEKAYSTFLAWCAQNNVPDKYFTANILIAYFEHEKKTKAPSTLWSIYSKLKKTLLARESVDIGSKTFKVVKEQIKSYGVDYQPKKSLLFSLEEIYTFCRDSDDQIYLAMKAIALLGMTGALRHTEIYSLNLEDIQDRGTELLVTIRSTKPHRSKSFIVQQHPDPLVDPVKIYRKYIALRPEPERLNKAKVPVNGPVWLRYERGKCSAQRIGKKTIAAMPTRIATFLKLASPEAYTGHAFRRTGATAAVNNGADLLQLKALGDWKSDAVAQGYLEDSEPAKRKRAAMVQGLPASKEMRLEVPPSVTNPIFNITGCGSVNINYIATPVDDVGTEKKK